MGLLGGSSGIGAGFHGYGDPTKGFNPAKGLHDIIGRPKGPNVSNPLGGLMGGGGGGGGGSSSSYSPIDPNSIAKPQYTAANVSPISVGQMSSQLDVSGINALKANALAAPGEA